jgi:CheY-like chemotaxis protein
MPVGDPLLPSREEFEKWLRDALNHLYDIGYLETHPLGELVIAPEQNSGRRGPDLRKTLIGAIQARKPPRGTPIQSPDWRGYQILEQHILAGLSPSEVAQKLNISRSLFFLEKTRVLKQLGEELWNSLPSAPLSAKLPAESLALPFTPPAPTAEALDLLERAVFEPVELGALLESLRPLLAAMAQPQAVHIDIDADTSCVVPRGERVLLRQVLLSLATELIQLAAGGEVVLRSFDQAGMFGVQIEARLGLTDQLLLRLDNRRGLSPATAQVLIAAMNGRLSLESGAGQAVLVWLHPAQGKRLLLVDDHTDIADLCRRWLEGSGWEVIWAASAEEARRRLTELRPAAILLDVILPHEDGWEYLIALKAGALTRDIPVIICSAIHEPDLMRSLGAQGYLPKPFSAAQLAQALAPFNPTDSLSA